MGKKKKAEEALVANEATSNIRKLFDRTMSTLGIDSIRALSRWLRKDNSEYSSQYCGTCLHNNSTNYPLFITRLMEEGWDLNEIFDHVPKKGAMIKELLHLRETNQQLAEDYKHLIAKNHEVLKENFELSTQFKKASHEFGQAVHQLAQDLNEFKKERENGKR